MRELVAADARRRTERQCADSAERLRPHRGADASTERDGSPRPARSRALGITPTPDDGNRLADRAVWDETERPVAPRIDADHNYTRHERARGQHLIDIHDHLRQELAQVRDLIDQVEAGMLGRRRGALDDQRR